MVVLILARLVPVEPEAVALARLALLLLLLAPPTLAVAEAGRVAVRMASAVPVL